MRASSPPQLSLPPAATTASKKMRTGFSINPFGNSADIPTSLNKILYQSYSHSIPNIVVEKIKKILTNVSKTNLRQKAKELKGLLKHEYHPSFTLYILGKFIITDSKTQRMFVLLLDYINSANLIKLMVESTYRCIKTLLKNDGILTSSTDRGFLKNLGSWLGLLTLAKNKPLRANKLCLKEQILDAYETGRLSGVLPFVTKVLEACARSRIFRMPNPWLGALLSLLKEIFLMPGVPMNLKYEIEVLCNTLSIKTKEVSPSDLLKDITCKKVTKASTSKPSARILNNMPSPRPEITPPTKTFTPSTNTNVGAKSMWSLNERVSNSLQQDSLQDRFPGPQVTQMQTQSSLPRPMQSLSRPIQPQPIPSESSQDQLKQINSHIQQPAVSQQPGYESTIIPNLPSFVQIVPGITLFDRQPNLKCYVAMAIDKAIQEIITPVVERSVTIACVTTRELILKDFAFELNENKIKNAAWQMAQNLTSRLALVTCIEPLRVGIQNNLASLLESNADIDDLSLVEKACTKISADNIELGCTLIEIVAADNAKHVINEVLRKVFKNRRKHGMPELNSPSTRSLSSLPDALRPKAGLTSQQLSTYEAFSNIRPSHESLCKYIHSIAGQEVDPQTHGSVMGQPNNLMRMTNSSQVEASSSIISNIPSGDMLTSMLALTKLLHFLENLEQHVSRIPDQNNTSLTSYNTVFNNREILRILNEVKMLLQKNSCSDDNVLSFARAVFQRIFETDSQNSKPRLDLYIELLKYTQIAFDEIVKKLTNWLLYTNVDDRKYIVVKWEALIRGQMVEVDEVDVYLTTLLHSGINGSRQSVSHHPQIKFVVDLVQRIVCNDPVVTVRDLAHLFEAISEMIKAQKINRKTSELLENLLENVQSSRVKKKR